MNLVFPGNATLRTIEQQYIGATPEDGMLVDEVFPEETDDADLLIWEQRDNYYGLQAIRGLDGPPPKVDTVGINNFTMQPGYYGEHMSVSETEITKRRQMGTFNLPVDISDLVLERNDMLRTRRINRKRQICSDLLTTGVYTVLGQEGQVVHRESYSPRTFVASVSWGTFATATPLADFRNMTLLARGYSMTLGSKAKAYANRATMSKLLFNTNAADLYGRRTSGLGTFNTLGDLSKLFMGENLPELVEFDAGYYGNDKLFHTFLPDNVVVVVGRRYTGTAIGGFRMTRNAQNADAAPGPYALVIDTLGLSLPRKIEVHNGMNGGPVLYFPSALILMKV